MWFAGCDRAAMLGATSPMYRNLRTVYIHVDSVDVGKRNASRSSEWNNKLLFLVAYARTSATRIADIIYERKSVWTKKRSKLKYHMIRRPDIGPTPCRLSFADIDEETLAFGSSSFWIKNKFTPTSRRPEILHIYERERLSMSLRRRGGKRATS